MNKYSEIENLSNENIWELYNEQIEIISGYRFPCYCVCPDGYSYNYNCYNESYCGTVLTYTENGRSSGCAGTCKNGHGGDNARLYLGTAWCRSA